jgi:hypothetical protein
MSELVVTLLRRAQDDPSYQAWLQQATAEELSALASLVRPPRTIWLPNFPFSLPHGLPGNEAMQHQLLLEALDMFVTCHTPGMVRCRRYRVWE